jgi:phage shock protein PspC (stress-responsive transcriptional regulator)
VLTTDQVLPTEKAKEALDRLDRNVQAMGKFATVLATPQSFSRRLRDRLVFDVPLSGLFGGLAWSLGADPITAVRVGILALAVLVPISVFMLVVYFFALALHRFSTTWTLQDIAAVIPRAYYLSPRTTRPDTVS